MSSRSNFSFELTHHIDGTLGRAGIIHTPHGDIKTPNFSVVGTSAAVRYVPPEMLHQIGAQAMLSNAYHLFRKAPEIAAAGGLAEYSWWNGPTITDSGGFQVMSLGTGLGKVVSMDKRDISDLSRRAADKDRLAVIDDDGVNFRHYLDGKLERFTPEVSMQIQHQIGADIMMAFDELTSIGDSYDYNVEALERTRLWADRCLAEHKRLEEVRSVTSQILQGKTYQALYGVLQGAHYQDLRKKAARDLGSMDFDGYGLGGAFEKEQLGDILKWVNSILPEHKPRHLLGLSKPDDIFIGVENGADTFDCVAPTREARHGRIYTRSGNIQLLNSQFKNDTHILDDGTDPNGKRIADPCDCPACAEGYTRAKLREMLKDVHHDAPEEKTKALTLLSAHNLRFTIKLFEDIRTSIVTQKFAAFRDEFLKSYYK